MIDTGPFEALAELGVALAGFTGVVVFVRSVFVRPPSESKDA